MDRQAGRSGSAVGGHVSRVHCLVEAVRRDALLLRGLDDRALARLLEGSRVEEYLPRRPLALGGAVPGACWLVLAGHAKEHRRLLDGGDVVTDVRGPGDLVAEGALQGTPSPVDVTALDAVTALELPARHLRRLVAVDAAVAAGVGAAVAARALSAQRSLIRNGRADTDERVVLALLELAQRFGADVADGRCIGVPLSQAELASWAGMSRETFAKVLRRLRARELVVTSRRDVVLTDVDALRASVGWEPPRPPVPPAPLAPLAS